MTAKLLQYEYAGADYFPDAATRGIAFGQVPLAWADRHAAGAVSGGLSLDGLYARALIEPRSGDGRDYISPFQLLVFYAALVLETDDGTHSLVRQRQAPAVGPMAFRLLFGSPSLGEGLETLARFYQLASPSMRLDLRTDADEALLALHVEDDRGDGLLEEDIQLVYLYLGLTSFVGRAFPVRWVGTRDPEHVGLGKQHYLIDAPVRLHGSAGLAFSKALLATRTRASFEEFAWQPIGKALDLLWRAPQGSSTAVSNQDLRVSRLAAERGVAPSTLRRWLARDEGGFRQLRRQALLNAALQQLATRTCSVDAIAADLGYADARSFRRFVKQATGLTPATFRGQYASSASPERLQARFREIIGVMPL